MWCNTVGICKQILINAEKSKNRYSAAVLLTSRDLLSSESYVSEKRNLLVGRA
jgi:hypothetical protein